MRILGVVLGTAITLLLSVFATSGEPGSIPVFVSILPQKYVVEKVGGAMVEVSVMVPPGASPHTYEPKPAQMVALSKATLYFAIGVPFEDVWLKRFASSSPRMKIVHTEDGVERIPMEAHHDHDEEGGRKDSGKENKDGLDRHGVMDPHVWLSPPNVKIIAVNISRALVETDPTHQKLYEDNCRKFIQEIDRLDAELKNLFAGKQGLKFMVFHPSWGYFAKTYGLKQVPVELEGKEPKPAQLMALIQQAKKEGIKVVFVQPQFSTRSAETIAKAIGGQVVFADPLSPEWARSLKEQAAKFAAALR
jgi:zinc transport system substrate-binding protein